MSALTPAEMQAWAKAKAAHASTALSPQDRAAWANARPMGAAEDAGRSAVTGLERAANGIAALPASLRDTWNNLPQAAQNATDWLFKQGGILPQNTSPSKAVRPVDQAARAGDLGALLAQTFPTQTQLDQSAQKNLGPYHQPQTWQGRTAQTVSEMAPNAFLPGGAAARVARVLVPALASSAAGEATHGTSLEKPARIAGGIVGGLAEGGIEAAANAPQRIFGDAARNLTDQQAMLAQQLRENAAREGIDLTVPEAVQQVTNGATGLGRVQRLVENASPTASRMAAYFAPRPGQVRGAVMNAADALSPETVATPPGVLGMRAQTAAQGGLDAVRGQINAATEPLYQALQGQEIPSADFAALSANPSFARALNAVRSDPELNGAIAHLPDNNLAVVNEVQKHLGTLATAARQTELNPNGNNFLAALRGQAADSADATARAASANVGAGEYGAARDVQSAARAAQLEPLQAGPVGAISRTADLGAQTGSLFPANPPLGQPAETAIALHTLNGQDGSLAGALLRQHVGNTFNQSTRDLVGGPSQYGGAMFAKNIAGNAEQAATLRGGLDIADPTGGAGDRMDALLEALRATGRRERPGSMTSFNDADINALKQAPAAIKFLGGLGDPLEWTKNLSNWTGGRLYGRNLNVLADLLTNPDTAAVLQQAQTAAATPTLPLSIIPAAAAGRGQ